MLDRTHLEPDERALIDFERTWWNYPEPKDRAIREVLGVNAAEYYRRLLVLIDDPRADLYDPLTVRRVRRVLEGARLPAEV